MKNEKSAIEKLEELGCPVDKGIFMEQTALVNLLLADVDKKISLARLHEVQDFYLNKHDENNYIKFQNPIELSNPALEHAIKSNTISEPHTWVAVSLGLARVLAAVGGIVLICDYGFWWWVSKNYLSFKHPILEKAAAYELKHYFEST